MGNKFYRMGDSFFLLEWYALSYSSWSLPVDVQRVPRTKTAQEIGAEQIKTWLKAEQPVWKLWTSQQQMVNMAIPAF